jgi:hypothetical protein
VAALLLPVLSLALPVNVLAQGDASEYQIKAAFLFHFAQFVDWPPEAFREAGSPVTFCTVGANPFGDTLEGTVSGKMIGNRPVRVQHFKVPQAVKDCQVLFVGAKEEKLIPALLAGVKDLPVITVGETGHFAELGGTIGFCWEGNKIRFEINLAAAQRAKLKISSRLLALAKTVIGGSGAS